MKIINNEYVVFHDILFPDSASKFILSFEANHSPMLVKDSKKRDLTENHWNKAFAEFAAIYTKTHPSTVTVLYTYQKRILYLMERKANWHYFDVQFRKDKQIAKSSWTDSRSDLYLVCLLQTSSSSSHTNPVSRSSIPSDFSRAKIPIGLCFAFHSSNLRCSNIPCNYKHTCPACGQIHPCFLHNSRHNSRGQDPQHAQPRQSNSQPRAKLPPVAR